MAPNDRSISSRAGSNPPSRGGIQRPTSAVSSHLTDIGTDNEFQARTSKAEQPQSEDQTPRPDTSASKGAKRYQSGFKTRGGGGGSAPPVSSLNNRSSHVPSLTSNAFFRPMSSQRLQAQRGAAPGSRAGVATQPAYVGDIDDGVTDFGGSVVPDIPSVPSPYIQRQTSRDEHTKLPPSRGTEATDGEGYGRITANTSPTQGHHHTGSMSDSVRPLNFSSEVGGSSNNLNVKVEKGHKDLTGLPSPIKSPKSFRSSFLMPGKSEQEEARGRSMEGAEKLSSGPSSPQLHQAGLKGASKGPAASRTNKKKQTNVHEHFDGNTIFFFGGRWQNTRGRPINIATGFFVVLPCVLFFIFEAPWLWHNVSPAVPIIFAYLAYLCVSSFIHASVSDPGVSNES